MKKWLPYLIFCAAALGVGALAGFLIREALQQSFPLLQKPPLTPPAAVFPVVWGILYLLMGIGAARVWCSGSLWRGTGLLWWAAQLAANFCWGLLFFRWQARLTAFFWLVLLWWLIFWMIRRFSQADRLAARLQLPYLVWTSFAGYLNLGVWYLNR